jgi:hypothetical protein
LNPFAWMARLVLGMQRKLHRTRVLPFLHADLIVAILLLAIAIVSGQSTVESLQSGHDPEPVPLSRIFSPEPMRNRYVEVEAYLLPETRLRYPPVSRGITRPVEFAYVAMLDVNRAHVLLVRFHGDLGHGQPRRVTVSGMLQAPDSALVRDLNAKRWQLGGVPIEQRYVLVANMTPKPTWLFAPACILSGGMALALLLAMSRPQSTSPEPNPGD